MFFLHFFYNEIYLIQFFISFKSQLIEPIYLEKAIPFNGLKTKRTQIYLLVVGNIVFRMHLLTVFGVIIFSW